MHDALRAMIDSTAVYYKSLYHFESLMMNADFLNERPQFDVLERRIRNSRPYRKGNSVVALIFRQVGKALINHDYPA